MDEDLAHSSIRFGLGRFTTEAEVDFTVEQVVKHVRRLRQMRQAPRLRSQWWPSPITKIMYFMFQSALGDARGGYRSEGYKLVAALADVSLPQLSLTHTNHVVYAYSVKFQAHAAFFWFGLGHCGFAKPMHLPAVNEDTLLYCGGDHWGMGGNKMQ